MMPNVVEYIKQFMPIDTPVYREDVINRALDIAENREQYRQLFIKKQEEIADRIIRQEVSRQVLNTDESERALGDTLTALGIDKR